MFLSHIIHAVIGWLVQPIHALISQIIEQDRMDHPNKSGDDRAGLGNMGFEVVRNNIIPLTPLKNGVQNFDIMFKALIIQRSGSQLSLG